MIADYVKGQELEGPMRHTVMCVAPFQNDVEELVQCPLVGAQVVAGKPTHHSRHACHLRERVYIVEDGQITKYYHKKETYLSIRIRNG